MTDKKVMADETILNGVDVSNCVFLNTDRNPYYATCDAYNGACSDNRHCYYKSLRRKIAENKEANKNAQDTYEMFQAAMESLETARKELSDKTAECEELKDKLKQAEFTLENKTAQTNIFKRRSKNYFKALNEIEEYCNKFGQNSIGFKKNILDIINKAKDGE